MDCCVVENISSKTVVNDKQSCKKTRARKSPHSVNLIDDENVPLAKYKNMKLEKVCVVCLHVYLITGYIKNYRNCH